MNIKGPFCDPNIKNYINKTSQNKKVDQNLIKNKTIDLNNKSIIKINSRSSTILPEFIGMSFAVYNGKEYKTFGIITPEHIGKKFGEFSSTKKPAIYKKKK